MSKNDQFVVHDGNRLANQIAELVARKPGDEFNPLTIYGPPGCGKTTLLMEMKDAFIGKKVQYLTAREYLALVSQTIKTDGPFETALQESFRKINEFRNSFGSNLDVLILDQAEDLVGYECTAIELSMIAERLVKSNTQVVFAFNRVPESVFPPLQTEQHPLIALLNSGCVVEIWDPQES